MYSSAGLRPNGRCWESISFNPRGTHRIYFMHGYGPRGWLQQAMHFSFYIPLRSRSASAPVNGAPV